MLVSPSDEKVLFVISIGGGKNASRSRDGGQNWLPIEDERGQIGARSLSIDHTDTNVVYLGSKGNGVYKSTDGGKTWSQANEGMLDYHITALCIDPAQSQTIYAGGDDGKLFKSTNGGKTWSDLTDKLPFSEHTYIPGISYIAIDPAVPEKIL
jgi:photosystem II stability/assembly factor-like uncharacterized protein